jgi:GntR family transcriptional regulator
LLPAIGEGLGDVDLSDISLYDYLESELKIELAHAQERIHAIALAAHEATLLEEELYAAALLSERVTFSVAGDPIMFDRAFMPGARVSIAADRFVSDLTVGYELRLDEEGE